MARNAAAGSDSKERMLEAAISLMRGSGLSGAGINEIVRESGAPKGSVYYFFPDGKLSLASEALTIYAQRVGSFLDAALSSRKRPEDKVRALFAAFAKRVRESGYLKSCPVGTVSLDLIGDACRLQPVLADALGQWVDPIAARHFDFGNARRTRAFASVVLTAVEGAYVRCRAELLAMSLHRSGEVAGRAGEGLIGSRRGVQRPRRSDRSAPHTTPIRSEAAARAGIAGPGSISASSSAISVSFWSGSIRPSPPCGPAGPVEARARCPVSAPSGDRPRQDGLGLIADNSSLALTAVKSTASASSPEFPTSASISA